MSNPLFKYRASELILKQLRGEISQAEQEELAEWKTNNPSNQALVEELTNDVSLVENITEFEGLEQRVKMKLYTAIPDAVPVIAIHRRSFFRIAVAASIILMIAFGGYLLFFNSHPKKVEVVNIPQQKDVEAPKGTKATITLADGRTISIDSLTTIDQANVEVRKTVDGQIAYSGTGTEVVFNTLTNPRGSKVIDLVLNDGSHVWLNAGSSLTYPVAFIGNDRKVAITGEAYFEVSKESRPFSVSKGDMNVQVLGTHFNVNAYDDEADIRVTLLEGSVILRSAQDDKGKILKPGQQAILRAAQDDKISVVNNVDLEQVMAWKNGTFYFNNTNIEVIMRQAGRWYDVEVSYEGNVKNEFFGGTVPRTENISQLIKALELTKTIKISVEGKRLIIRPAK